MAISDYVPDHVIVATLRRLSGQFCTPPGTDRELVKLVVDRGLIRFHEWPSGHWSLTERGGSFLSENS